MPENAKTIVRLAAYARVSTEEQKEGQTINSQLAELERFSREKSWPIVDVYKDEGWSGGVMARPELDRLRDDAGKQKFDAVLVNDVDRLARDVAHLGVIKRDLERKGVQVIFRKLPSDQSPTYNLMVNILGSFAEFERELIADRVRRGRRYKIEVKKQYLGSNTSYGYRYVRKNVQTGTEGLLEIAPKEAAVVRQMFAWVDEEGLSARRVLGRLNELKIPPMKGAPQWGKSSVLRILKTETYAGTWYYNKFQGCEPANPTAKGYRKRTKSSIRLRPRNEWLPLSLPESLRIVSMGRWQRVQEQLSRNLTFSPRNEKHHYLLKGLVRCGVCGATYVGDPGHGHFVYRCAARCKKLPTVSEARLNNAVQRAVAEVILNPELILEPLRQLASRRAEDKRQQRTTVQDLEYESERLGLEEQRILDAYRTGIITPAQLAPQLEKLKTVRAAIEGRRQHLSREQDMSIEEAEKTVEDYCVDAAKKLATFTSEQWREFLRTVVESIEFEGSRVTIWGRIPAAGASPARPIPFQGSSAIPSTTSQHWPDRKSA